MFFFFFNDIQPIGASGTENSFDSKKKYDDDGNEFWYARDLQTILGYAKWDNFLNVIEKAKIACQNSGFPVSLHFADVGKIVHLGVADRNIQDIVLSRYACYLIAMNGDSKKPVVAQAQTYFAVKTHEREVSEQFNALSEDQKRLAIRNDLKEHNSSLANAANQAGVVEPRDYAIFQNEGYKGLYGGLGQKEIHTRKGLKKSQKILDHMGSTELAANLFRATQTDEKLRREKIKGKELANKIHHEVGAKVRQTIKELGGTMPENLPTPPKSIKQLEKEQKKVEGK
jgi:DNA-damage-inducible protein D